jgi:DNA-binding HxlR family transcriptional regulator
MSTRDNAAIHQLLALLEARYAIRVLWALRDGHPQTFRLLQDSVGGITPNTLNTRIKELREAGLLGHGPDGYCVTPTGADLLKRLSELPAFAAKWAAVQGKKKQPTTPIPPAP